MRTQGGGVLGYEAWTATILLSTAFACHTESIPLQDAFIDESGDPSPTSMVGDLPLTGNLDAFIHVLVDDDATIQHAQSITAYKTLVQREQYVEYFDDTEEAMIIFDRVTHMDAVALNAQDTLMSFSGELYIFDGQWLQASPLNDLFPVPVEHLYRDSYALWFQGAGRLYRYAEQTLTALQNDTQEEIRRFAPGRDGRIAIASPHLLLIDSLGSSFEILDSRPDISPKDIVFDQEGALWSSDGSTTLYRRAPNGQWGRLLTPSAILDIQGQRLSSELWIKTEDMVIHHRNGVFHTVTMPDGEWLDSDEYGRLLVKTDDALLRVALDRKVVVAGLDVNGTLSEPTDIRYIPMDPSTLSSLQAWVDQEPLPIDSEAWRSTLDPNDYAVGSHVLRITSVGPEGARITEIPFSIGDLPDTKWEGEIDLLMTENCLQCHNQGASLPLHTIDQWRQHIDRIISEVVSNSMPLGGPYLSNAEIQMIRGWKNGGFQ